MVRRFIVSEALRDDITNLLKVVGGISVGPTGFTSLSLQVSTGATISLSASITTSDDALDTRLISKAPIVYVYTHGSQGATSICLTFFLTFLARSYSNDTVLSPSWCLECTTTWGFCCILCFGCYHNGTDGQTFNSILVFLFDICVFIQVEYKGTWSS